MKGVEYTKDNKSNITKRKMENGNTSAQVVRDDGNEE